MRARKQNEWKLAVKEELGSTERNNIWFQAAFPPGRDAILCNAVLKGKPNEQGHTNGIKAILLTKGYSQEHAVDYHWTFTPVTLFNVQIFVVGMLT